MALRPADRLLTRRLVDGWLVLVPGAAAPLALQGTAGACWDELRAGTDPERATARLAEAFGADPDAVRADLDALCRDLLAAGVLEDPEA